MQVRKAEERDALTIQNLINRHVKEFSFTMFEQVWCALKEILLLESDKNIVGLCWYYIRKDKILVIYNIVSEVMGGGSLLLTEIEKLPHIFMKAVCPADLPANEWYEKKGFALVMKKKARSGRPLNVWGKSGNIYGFYR